MRYPNIFIHGLYGWGSDDGIDSTLPYWGSGENNVIEFLRAHGYECYYPSLGPFNSAWDRACILWAYLFGGQVDYGKVHSKKHGHARWGKVYPGVLKDLGTTEEHAVAYGIDRAAFNQGQNAKFGFAVETEAEPTIVAKGPVLSTISALFCCITT